VLINSAGIFGLYGDPTELTGRSLVGLRESDATCGGRPTPAAKPVPRALIGSWSRTGP
jgi:hypothetical protein